MAVELNLVGGTSYYDAAHHADFAFTDKLTVECWFRARSLSVTPNSGGRALVSHYDYATNEQFAWGLQTSDNTGTGLKVFLSLGGGGYASGDSPSGLLSVGIWYNAAFVYDGALVGNANRLKLWLNGTQQTLTFTGTVPAQLYQAGTPATLKIGRMIVATQADRFFLGALDEVRIWNVARTIDEIKSSMNSRIAAVQTGLVGLWRTNEIAVPTTLLDWTARGHDATKVGTDFAIQDGPAELGGAPFHWLVLQDASPSNPILPVRSIVSRPGFSTSVGVPRYGSKLVVPGYASTVERR